MRRLYSDEFKARASLYWKDVVEAMEDAVNTIEDISDVVEAHRPEARLTRSDGTLGVIVVIAIALAFDFVNGFHDAANSIATVVSTQVLSPRLAVFWAAFFNFVAFLVFGTVVAATIATGVVDPDVLSIGVDVRRTGRRHRLEPDHLLPRPAHELVARPRRRDRRRRRRQGRLRRADPQQACSTIGVFIVLSPLLGLALGDAR